MYEDFFGLSDRPFVAAPDAERFFPSASIQSARETALRCLRRAEGTAVIMGPVGTGKTILCQRIAVELAGEFQVAMLASGRLCTRRALLQAVLYGLGLEHRGMDEGELRLAIQRHLDSSLTEPNNIVLIVDEADTLPIRLIEELRVLANSRSGTREPIGLLLAGGPRLEERLASPKLEAFGQRITARCYLDSMCREETVEYMRAQLRAVGLPLDRLFTKEACRAVYRATDGIARLVNQLCDHALLFGFSEQRRLLDTADIDIAWADLQQLPAPVVDRAEDSPSDGGNMVEFGELDDVGQIEANHESDDLLGARQEKVSDGALSSLIEQQPFGGHDDSPEAPTTSLPFSVVGTEPAGDLAQSSSIGPEGDRASARFLIEDDPFGESFESEEVLIDHYASLDGELLGRRPRVKSQLGREFSASLTGYSIEEIGPGEPIDDDDPYDLVPTAAMADPVLPEPIVDDASVDSTDGTIPVVVSPVDDPVYPEDELIVIEEENALDALAEEEMVETTNPSQTHRCVQRQQYRELFTNLQRGSC